MTLGNRLQTRVKLVLLFTALMFAASTMAQKSSRVEYIRFLGQTTADESTCQILLNALKDQDFAVRREALSVWSKVFYAYDQLWWPEVIEEDSAYSRQQQQLQQKFHLDLIKAIRPSGNDDLETKLAALRTLCSMDYSVQLLFDFNLCGTGAELTFPYKVSHELAVQATVNCELFKGLVEDPDPQIVYSAVNALGEQYCRENQPMFLGFLTRSNKFLRGIGIKTVEAYWPKITPKSLTPLLEDPDEDVREYAKRTITLEKDQFLKLAESNKTPIALRVLAIEKFAYTDDSKVRALLRSLIENRNIRVRSAAIGAYFGEKPSCDPTLLTKLLSDPSPEVQAQVLVPAAKAKIDGLHPYVKAGLLCEDAKVRQAAIFASMQLPNEGDLTLEQVQSVSLGVEYCDGINPKFGDPRFANLIEECVNSPVPNVRRLVSNYLWNRIYSHQSFSLDLVIQLAKDPDIRVARLMIQELTSIKEAVGFETLVGLTRSTSVEIRCKAIDALGSSKQKEAIAVLEKLLSDASNEVRNEAKLGMKRLRQP